jgi:hypothetical protein
MIYVMKILNEDTDTEYSSWNDDEISSLTSNFEANDDESHLDDEDDISSTQTLHRTILSERAAMLIRRESSYCMDDVSAKLSGLSLQSCPSYYHNTCTCQNKTGSCTTIDVIDLKCRIRMMEWSFNVVEFSFPPPSSSSSRHKRKHSVETLLIISAAFSYVDRVMAQQTLRCSARSKKLQIHSKRDYKLLCMISLHLAAKMSGLFSQCDQEYEYQPEDSRQGMKNGMKSNSSVSSLCTATTACSFSNSSTGLSCISNVDCLDEKHCTRVNRRPLLHLLSLGGLHTLCQAEFSVQEMCQMELSILSTLEWRLNGGLVLEWLGLLLESAMYCHSYGLACDQTIGLFDLDEVKEDALFQLEAVIKSDIPVAMKPSMMAIAVWANAMRLCMSRMQIVSFLQHIDIYCGADQLESSMDTLKF